VSGAVFLGQDAEKETVRVLHFHFAGGQGRGQVTLKWLSSQAVSENFSDSYAEAQWGKQI